MAYGTSQGLRAYVNKVFGLERRLGALSDGRCEPHVPLGPILTTWFLGLARRLPSTEEIGRLLRDPRWQRRLELSSSIAGSADTAARALDGLVIDELNDVLLEMFFAARRAGVLGDDGPYGKHCVVVDLNELFKSERRCCSQCQQRHKTVQRADGSLEEVTEYFHQAVALVWAGKTTWPIGWELLRPGEGELTAALRLLERLLPKLRRSVDLVLGDALYCCRPYFALARRHGGSGAGNRVGPDRTRRGDGPVCASRAAACDPGERGGVGALQRGVGPELGRPAGDSLRAALCCAVVAE